jgi:site-specific DNA-methyltransferase (adenine-specific)
MVVMRKEFLGDCEISNEDCMELMPRYPDGYFDMAIVDPPYGDAGGTAEWDRRGRIPATGRFKKYKKPEHGRFGNDGSRFEKYRVESRGGAWAEKYGELIKDWDIAPPPEYFKELFRVTKGGVIIWGGNYFTGMLPPNRNFIVWDKKNISPTFTMAMCEYAWTNIPGNSRIIPCIPQDPDRFHPTQKPVYLYTQLLKWYSDSWFKILDTHLGSGSNAIACIEMGCSLTACEIDPMYYDLTIERIKKYLQQKQLFDAAQLRREAEAKRTLFDEVGTEDE